MPVISCQWVEGNCDTIPDSIVQEAMERDGMRRMTNEEAGKRYREMQLQAIIESTHYKVSVDGVAYTVPAYSRREDGSYSFTRKREAIRFAKLLHKLSNFLHLAR